MAPCAVRVRPGISKASNGDALDVLWICVRDVTSWIVTMLSISSSDLTILTAVVFSAPSGWEVPELRLRAFSPAPRLSEDLIGTGMIRMAAMVSKAKFR